MNGRTRTATVYRVLRETSIDVRTRVQSIAEFHASLTIGMRFATFYMANSVRQNAKVRYGKKRTAKIEQNDW